MTRLYISDCAPEEVALARILHEVSNAEALEEGSPSDKSISLKQARAAIAAGFMRAGSFSECYEHVGLSGLINEAMNRG